MKTITKFLSIYVSIILTTTFAFAKTVYLTDLEGRIESLNQHIQDGTFIIAADGTLEFSDNETKFVFGGDLMDRGPNTIRLMKLFTSLKLKYPDRVHLILGNRDLNKLSFSIDREEKMLNIQDPKYREFLNNKLEQIENHKTTGVTIESLNTPELQVQWWAEQYGLTKAIEFHQEELRALRKVEVSYSEATRDFADMISNPNREYLNYLKLGQLVHSDGPVIYLHGGLPAQNGFVPDSATVHENFSSWETALNEWARSKIADIITGISQGRIGQRGRSLIYYGDALYDNSLKKIWNHDNSVVYGPRFKENGNFRLPSESNIRWLNANGKTTVILGHSPAGNVPTPLRGLNIFVVMGDTSYSDYGLNTKITVDGDVIEVSGKLGNGTDIYYKTSVNDRSSPIGLQFGNETVIGTTRNNEIILFKYVGYEKDEKIVTRSEVPLTSLTSPIYLENSEFENQKRLLLKTLSERGTRAIDLNTFESDFMNNRRPVLFSGSSAYSDSSQLEAARQMIEAALKNLDPSKVVIVTGGTEMGPEKLVHEIGSKLGFYIHALVVSAAKPEDVSKNVNSISWVGHDWASQPKIGMEFIQKNKGFGIILGGGGLLQKALEHGRSIGAKFIVASNIKHGNGSLSASMNFSLSMRENSFSDGNSLLRILKRSFYQSLKKTIYESTSEQAINALKGRGKQVVTFIGFSGAGYQDIDGLKKILKEELSMLDPKKTIINIGGTSDGIGLLYEIAKQMGFQTSAIVSSKAKVEMISPYCDITYMIKDQTWGGFVNNTHILSPTSKAMVRASDLIIAIGGGAIGRDEFLTAQKFGIPTKFRSAEMDQQKLKAKAEKAGKPVPTEFRGDLELELIKLGQFPNSPLTTNNRTFKSLGGNRCIEIFSK